MEIKKGGIWILLIVLLVLFALAASYNNKINIIGLVINIFPSTEQDLSQNLTYVDTLDLEINESSTYDWTIGNFCSLENCTLKSISVSGFIIANQSGNVSIYIENSGRGYLILNKNFELSKTIISQNITTEQNITFTNETINEAVFQTINTAQEVNATPEQPETNETIISQNITSEQNITYINETVQTANITQEVNITVEQQENITAEQNISVVNETTNLTTVQTVNITQEVNVTAEQNSIFINETTNETFIQTLNVTQEVNATVEQPEIFYFNDSCIETCNLTDVFNTSYYNLRFDLTQNISLMLYSISYSWVIEKWVESRPEENITEINTTGNQTIERDKTVKKHQSTIDFKGRKENKNYPENWFIKSEINLENSDEGIWEGIPLTESSPDVLFIDLFKLNHPEEWYRTPSLKIYSKVIENLKESYYSISFYYKPEFVGECLQVGMEVLSNDGASVGTFMLNLNETGVTPYFSDFNSTSEFVDDWIYVTANSNFPFPSNTIIRFYFAALCDQGNVYIKSFAYNN